MKKLTITAAALLLAATVPASAIEYTPDDVGQPYVFNPGENEGNPGDRTYAHFAENACGATRSGTLGTCASADCAVWSIGGRIFRDGVATGPFCGDKACPGGNFNPGTTMSYQAYYFNTNQDECECISVDFDNGSCAASVHGSLFEGVVDPNQTWACTMLPDASYLGDQGGSLAANDFSGVTSNEHVTVLSHSNFGVNTACNYSFSITCSPVESLSCALAPIEAKLDALLLGGGGGGTASGKAAICHIDSDGTGKVQFVDGSAIPSHMAHGDCNPPAGALKGDECDCP